MTESFSNIDYFCHAQNSQKPIVLSIVQICDKHLSFF